LRFEISGAVRGPWSVFKTEETWTPLVGSTTESVP
jgi:hypothetical protein